MKIAILGTRGIPNNYGGYEQLAEYLSVGLVKKGHEVTVYNNQLHIYKEKIYKGVNIRHVYSPENLLGNSANIIYDYLCLLDSLILKHDIILECGYQSSAIGYYFAPINRSIIITNMDGLDWKRSKWRPWIQKLTKYFEKLAVKKSHALIADNLGMKEYFYDNYGVESHLVTYGTSEPEIINNELLSEFDLTPFRYNLIVARLEPENNIEMILDGYVKSNQTFEFVVIGNSDTSYGNHLKTKYSNFRKIKFIGGVYNQDKLNTIRANSNYYFHGHSVGGTNPSLLDAMACSCFVIAHNNNFNKNVLNENAIYFSDSEEVKIILNKESLRSSFTTYIKNNLEEIRTNYTWSKIIDDHEVLFNKLLVVKKNKTS